MKPFGAAILAPEGLRLSPAEKTFFAGANPFGFILFARNLESPPQIRGLCAALRDCVGWNAPIFIDQEGGRVQRLRPPLARDWRPPLEDVAHFGSDAARAIELRYALIGAELLDLGIDGNCVPTLDVARPETHAILRNRCFGTDPETVIAMGRAVLRGCAAAGIHPVIKHMPGHGLATVDSHLDLPRVQTDRRTLESTDFATFAAFSDAPMGMSAHLIFEQIDPRPATISPVMIDLIRRQIGFDGLLMTDDISMEALSGSIAQRGAAALAAGCDLVLHCNGNLEEMTALIAATDPMPPAAQARAEAALAARIPARQLDIAALTAELDALEGIRARPDRSSE